jgi:hypothetical protein
VKALNRPTADGRAAGLLIAKLCDEREARLQSVVGPTPPRCADCAARLGTLPNGCEQTLADFAGCVAAGSPFFCHSGIDLENNPNPEPRLICRGWVAMARPEDVARVIAIIKAGL